MELTKKEEQGARLSSLIDALNLTQTEFSKRIGISQAYVNRMLTGEKSISYRVINGITRGFESVNVDWLLTGSGDKFKRQTLEKVEEPGVRYEARSDDPTGALRGTLEYLLERVANLEKRVSLLEGRKDES